MASDNALPELAAKSNIHVVKIDKEMFHGLDNLVNVETNLDDLPPSKGRATEYKDVFRYSDFQAKEELKFFEKIRVSPHKQTVVRCHRDVFAVVEEMTVEIGVDE